VGARVTDIRTYGKHLVVVFGGKAYLHNHLMMWGKWRIYDRKAFDEGKAKPPPRIARGARVGPTVSDVRLDSRVRLTLVTAEKVAIEFNGPILRFTTGDPSKNGAIARLGPDALERPFRRAEAARRLVERGALKLADLLLDQTFVAGVGNKYKSEILFLTRLDPFQRASQLSLARRQALIEKIPEVLRFGYEHSGWTRTPDEGETGSRWAVGHWVFRRPGRPCHVCGTSIVADRSSSARVTYLCPRCQRASSPSRTDRRRQRTRVRSSS
jgi:endonuclease-8